MMKVEDVMEIMQIKMIGIIKERKDVMREQNVGQKVKIEEKRSEKDMEYMDDERRIEGEDVKMNVKYEKRGIMGKILGRREE